MKQKYDAIIIGAGIIGCCTAFELCKKGYKTINVDFQSNAGAGSTASSCGNVRFHYSTLDGVALAYESAWYWHNWKTYIDTEDERGYAPFGNTGSVYIKSKGLNWPRIKKKFDKVGVKYEEWDLETLKSKVPISDFHSFYPPRLPEDPRFWDEPSEILEGASYTPESGYVTDPTLATQNVEAAARAKGGKFLYKRKVIQIFQDADRVAGVSLDDGQKINAPIVINIAGPHSSMITELAGQTRNNAIKPVHYATRCTRSRLHGFDPEEEGYHTNDTDIGAYYRPETGGMILTGSVDPECDPKEFVDPNNYNTEVTANQWKAQVYRLARRIPDLPIPTRPMGIVDLYDVSDDWIPIYDKSDLEGYYQAIGTSGNQFKTAPVAGGLMADLVQKVEVGYPHDQFPIQYKLPHLGITIDTGVFHRNRKINPNSSFSVIG